MSVKIKQTLLFVGDIILLYASLFAMLFFRYGNDINSFISIHIGPFTLIFILWAVLFYIIGMYDVYLFGDTLKIIQNLAISVISGIAISIIFFYAIPYFQITPKTNLIIFSIIFGVLDLIWRKVFQIIFKAPQRIAVVLGGNKDAIEMKEKTIKYPQLGYKIALHFPEKELPSAKELADIMKDYDINTIILMRQIDPSDELFDTIYNNITEGIEIIEFANVYELLFKKVPISEIRHMWILTSISKNHRAYDAIKRPFEFILALILLITLSPIFVLIWLAIRLTSKGKAIYSQKRVGKNNKEFILYKFRTMKQNAEKDGAQWAQEQDPRVTKVGKFLRFTHLDELPQLVNILKGEISFVGPRPERPEFVKTLSKSIPYYEIRHMINPGITGWAQVNYRYGASIEDAYQKLQYDMYYLKHRSLMIDFISILKTIKMFLFNYK